MEEESWRRSHGGGVMQEMSGRHLKGICYCRSLRAYQSPSIRPQDIDQKSRRTFGTSTRNIPNRCPFSLDGHDLVSKPCLETLCIDSIKLFCQSRSTSLIALMVPRTSNKVTSSSNSLPLSSRHILRRNNLPILRRNPNLHSRTPRPTR